MDACAVVRSYKFVQATSHPVNVIGFPLHLTLPNGGRNHEEASPIADRAHEDQALGMEPAGSLQAERKALL